MKLHLYIHSVKGNFIRCLFISSYEGKPLNIDEDYKKLMKLCDEAKNKFCLIDHLPSTTEVIDKSKLFSTDVTAEVKHHNMSVPINDNVVFIKVPLGLSYVVDKYCGKYADVSITHYVYSKTDGTKGITFYLSSIKDYKRPALSFIHHK